MNKLFVILAIALIVLILGPIATIAALNTLFPNLGIPINIWSWLSVAWLQIVFVGNISSSVRSK